MTRFKYYSNYLACLLGTLIAFELCWIGAKYVIEGEVVHTCLDCSALSGPDYETLRKMEKKGYVASGKPGEKGIYFWMTREGLDWLGEKIRIRIHDPRD